MLSSLAEEDNYIFLDTNKFSRENRLSYLFIHPAKQLVCTAQDDLEVFFNLLNNWLRRGFYVAGWFSYEFGYLLDPVLRPMLEGLETEKLACLWCYEAPLKHDHFSTLPSPFSSLTTKSEVANFSYSVNGLRVAERKADYLEHLREIKEYIAAGDTYQVNYTTSLLFDFSGSPEGLYRELRRNQSVAYAALIKDGEKSILSLSPELFFRLKEDAIAVRPMKGTARRGKNQEEDRVIKEYLASDIKNRSENVMIVDLLRNDLGRICHRPSVRTDSLFDVESYETLHQMTSSISGRLHENFSWRELFAALFPCGSVTGAPKIRTMEIIRELEASARGVYTGAIGFISPSGEAVFNIPIRTVTVEKGKGCMGIGSGVVYDSDPEQEWQECLLKGLFLSHPQAPYQLIETIYWHPREGFWLLEDHVERLMRSAEFLNFFCNRQEVLRYLHREVEGTEQEKEGRQQGRRVRLLLAKDGSLAVSSQPCQAPLRNLLPDLLPEESLPAVCISDRKTRTEMIELYHKTTRRAIYDEERKRALDKGCFEVLFVNERNELTEGSISNLFVRTGSGFVTPPLNCGLLEGVFRRHFIRNCPVPIREQVLHEKDLHEADALYIGNSVRGLVQVALRMQGEEFGVLSEFLSS